MIKKFVGFGDYLIHFSPFGNQRFAQANCMDMSFTGAEANVCAALSLWGENTEFVTALPSNELAKRSIRFARGLGIETKHIHIGDGRMGLYFLEKGASLRSSSVIYDRDSTVFTNTCFEAYNWNEIFKECMAFYTTGITAALSDNLKECTKKALITAKEKGVFTFFDLNFRSKLGTYEHFKNIIMDLSPYIDCLIINEEHSKMLFGLCSEFLENETEKRLNDYISKVRGKTGILNIAMPVRRTLSSSDARIYGAYSCGGGFGISKAYDIHVVDRVGSGDAFSAGIIYSYMHSMNPSETAEFSVASSAYKHTVESDINFSSLDEIYSIASGVFDVKR